MKIEVTLEDIKNGIKGDASACPIAQSLIRNNFVDPEVAIYVSFYENGFHKMFLAPQTMLDFMNAFDNNSIVSCVTFEIPDSEIDLKYTDYDYD